MYTIDNSINTLQDLMQHIWKLSRIEPAIFNNYCAILAVRKGTEEERKAPCFTDERIAKHCYDFLHSMMRGAMLEGTFTNTC